MSRLITQRYHLTHRLCSCGFGPCIFCSLLAFRRILVVVVSWNIADLVQLRTLPHEIFIVNNGVLLVTYLGYMPYCFTPAPTRHITSDPVPPQSVRTLNQPHTHPPTQCSPPRFPLQSPPAFSPQSKEELSSAIDECLNLTPNGDHPDGYET